MGFIHSRVITGFTLDSALVAVGSLWPGWCPKNNSQTFEGEKPTYC
jgi:hypothetical protein